MTDMVTFSGFAKSLSPREHREFVRSVTNAAKVSEPTVSLWASGRRTPDALHRNTVARMMRAKYNITVTGDSLFPER